MTDRLQELLRQKALLAEHAAWLEREIAAETAIANIIAAHAASAPAQPASPPVTTDTEANSILERYREPTKSIHQGVLRGCLVYMLLALVLLGLGVAAIYFFYHRR